MIKYFSLSYEGISDATSTCFHRTRCWLVKVVTIKVIWHWSPSPSAFPLQGHKGRGFWFEGGQSIPTFFEGSSSGKQWCRKLSDNRVSLLAGFRPPPAPNSSQFDSVHDCFVFCYCLNKMTLYMYALPSQVSPCCIFLFEGTLHVLFKLAGFVRGQMETLGAFTPAI